MYASYLFLFAKFAWDYRHRLGFAASSTGVGQPRKSSENGGKKDGGKGGGQEEGEEEKAWKEVGSKVRASKKTFAYREPS